MIDIKKDNYYLKLYLTPMTCYNFLPFFENFQLCLGWKFPSFPF